VQKYVLIYANPVIGPDSGILLILKNKPAWQVGKLNLVGGKIEPGEEPGQAALRELKEETGLEALSAPRVMGTISGSWGIVFCVKISVNGYEEFKPRAGETELPLWADWHEIKNHELLMPNLRVVLPLMMCGVTNFNIKDEGPDWKSNTHEYMIRVPSHNKKDGVEPIDRS